MRKKVVVLGSVLLLGLLVAASPLVVSCAPKAEVAPPEEVYRPDEFTIYITGDMSGPMAPINCAMPIAYPDFVDFYNREFGGIRGVPVAVVLRDNAGDLAAGIAAYEYFRLQKPKPVIGFMHPTYVSIPLRERIVEDDIVNWMNGTTTEALFPIANTIASPTSYTGNLAVACEYILNSGRWKGETIKLGILTWDNAFGRGIMDDLFREWVAENPKVEIVAEEVFKPGEIDVSTQITRLKGKGANVIACNTLSAGPGVIRRSMESLGVLAKSLEDWEPGLMYQAGNIWDIGRDARRINGEIMDGMIGPRNMASFDEVDNPGIKFATEVCDAHAREEKYRGLYYTMGWAKAYTVCEMVGELVDEYGWEGVTGTRLFDKLLHLKGYDALGMLSWTYTPTCPMPTTTRIYESIDGKILPVTDWLDVPDLRPHEFRD